MAWPLLFVTDRMEPAPGQVIRSLRQALEMSQAEFARAAGWSPSTISSWERGRAKPSRLAFKTILAFAEERGVRYRPRPSPTLALTAPQDAPTASGVAAFKPDVPPVDRAHDGPRRELRPLLYSDYSATVPPPVVSTPPRWSAEGSFRLTLGARHPAPRTYLPRGVAEIAIAAVAFCVAFGLREPLHRWLRPPPSSMTAAAHAIAPAVVRLPGVSAASAPLPALASADAPSDSPHEPPLAPVVTARLESVIAIGGAGRATFRTANDAVTVIGGEWLGSRQVADIGSDGVTLVDREGVSRRIHVGQQITFE